MTLPSGVSSGLVKGRFIRAVIDGPDAGDEPDGIPIPGLRVTMRAMSGKQRLTHAQAHGATPPTIIFFDEIVCETDAEGVLTHNGVSSFRVVATDDPDVRPNGFTYEVEISTDASPALIRFQIPVPSGSVVDLAKVMPVPDSPAADVREWIAVRAEVLAAQASLVSKTVTRGRVDDDNLVLIRTDGTEHDSGRVRGRQGLPGVNAVTNDEASAGYISSLDPTQTREALRLGWSQVDAVTEGKPLRTGATGTSRRIVATGHSLFYGQDTTSTGTNAPVNGATQKRSSSPPTSVLSTQAGFMSTSPVVVVNQTYPGDRTSDALTRWTAGESGDIELFWLDTNDAMNYGNRPGGPLTDYQTTHNLATLAKRARDRGAPFIVIGGAPVASATNSWRVYSATTTQRQTVQRLGGTFIDAGELLADRADDEALYWTDGVHLTAEAYALVGARLAALLGPKGSTPPRVSPGRRFTWRDQLHVGGTLTDVPSLGIAGKVLRIVEGETISLAFDVAAPVTPIVRFRTTTAEGVAGLYSNLNLNRAPIRATVSAGSSQPGIVWLKGPPVTSPGPSGFVVRAESGVLDIISIEFEPYVTAPPSPQCGTYGPVGGAQSRASTTWDAQVAWDQTLSLRTGTSQTTRAPHSLLFDLRLGPSNSGVGVTASPAPTMPYIVRNGYLLLRTGSSLLVRSMLDGTPTDLATIANAFPAAGLAVAALEIAFMNDGRAVIYLNGSTVHTIPDHGLALVTPVLLAGGSNTFAFVAGSIQSR